LQAILGSIYKSHPISHVYQVQADNIQKYMFQNSTGTARIKSGAEVVCHKDIPIQLHDKG